MRTFFVNIWSYTYRYFLMFAYIIIIALLLSTFFLPVAFAADWFTDKVRDEVLDVPPLEDPEIPAQNSFVYAADGSEIAELSFEENRVPIELDEAPQSLIGAVLATEDAQFYQHSGVNHLSIVRAALSNFRAGGIESGASTITQQYVKLAFLSPEQTLERKVEEAIYATQLEQEISKDDILERYLNLAYFGSGAYGVGTASQRYFSKHVSELTLGESAMLAGLLRAPELNNPIRSIENAETRRDIVLRQMVNEGFVSEGQAQRAKDTPIELNVFDTPPPDIPEWVTWVTRLLVNEDTANQLGTQTDALETLGATTEERRDKVFQGGLRIFTTLDPEMQQLAQQTIVNTLSTEDMTPEEIAQGPLGSIVSVEPGTGAIRAAAVGPKTFGSCLEDDSWVGTADDGQLLCDKTQVNMAVPGGGGSGRQPGSAYKPFVSAAAMEQGVSPARRIDSRGPRDIPGCSTDSGPYTVRNSGGNDILDMYGAMQRSSNVYHALVTGEIGPERVAEMAERLTGFPVPSRDVFCPLSLGATDTTPLAMASGYATLANRGKYCAPYPIERIEDAFGRVIWEHTQSCEQVVDVNLADRMVDILVGPVIEGGTAPQANLEEWPTRGKTGTTNDTIDAWFVGFVKQMSTAAWIGFENGQRVYNSETSAQEACGERASATTCPPARQTMQNVTIANQFYSNVFGGTLPAPMWHDYMRDLVEMRYEPQEFDQPNTAQRTTTVPNIRDLNFNEASTRAREAGLAVDFIEVESVQPFGTPLTQTPEAGASVAPGTVIVIEVSDGRGPLPQIPDVTGQTMESARQTLEGNGWNVSVRYEENSNVDSGRVIRQTPEEGARYRPDEFVVIIVSL